MSKSDLKGFEELMKDVKSLDQGMNKFLADFLIEMALRAQERIIDRTPVGIYDEPVSFTTKDGKEVSFTPHTNQKGGEMRRSWKLGSVRRKGDLLYIEIYNDAKNSKGEYYAGYVNDGHRIKNQSGQVVGYSEGYHMTEISIHEIEQQIPLRLQKAWNKYCAEKLK